jgi:hypothetical protein
VCGGTSALDVYFVATCNVYKNSCRRPSCSSAGDAAVSVVKRPKVTAPPQGCQDVQEVQVHFEPIYPFADHWGVRSKDSRVQDQRSASRPAFSFKTRRLRSFDITVSDWGGPCTLKTETNSNSLHQRSAASPARDKDPWGSGHRSCPVREAAVSNGEGAAHRSDPEAACKTVFCFLFSLLFSVFCFLFSVPRWVVFPPGSPLCSGFLMSSPSSSSMSTRKKR